MLNEETVGRRNNPRRNASVLKGALCPQAAHTRLKHATVQSNYFQPGLRGHRAKSMEWRASASQGHAYIRQNPPDGQRAIVSCRAGCAPLFSLSPCIHLQNFLCVSRPIRFPSKILPTILFLKFSYRGGQSEAKAFGQTLQLSTFFYRFCL